MASVCIVAVVTPGDRWRGLQADNVYGGAILETPDSTTIAIVNCTIGDEWTMVPTRDARHSYYCSCYGNTHAYVETRISKANRALT